MDRPLHACRPRTRHAVRVAVVVERDYFFSEDPQQLLGIAPVVRVGRRVRFADADREPVRAVVGLRPPAVQDREVQAAVQQYLLPAGAGRFLRPAGIVEPHVDALHELATEADVVVLEEDQLAEEAGVPAELVNLPQHALGRLVARVRLARNHELDGALRVVDETRQAVRILQEQRRPLVGGHPAGETDGQGVLAQRVR